MHIIEPEKGSISYEAISRGRKAWTVFMLVAVLALPLWLYLLEELIG